MSKKYEDEKEEFIEKIKNLNQQLFDLDELEEKMTTSIWKCRYY